MNFLIGLLVIGAAIYWWWSKKRNVQVSPSQSEELEQLPDDGADRRVEDTGGWESFRFGMSVAEVVAEAKRSGMDDFDGPRPPKTISFVVDFPDGYSGIRVLVAHHPNGVSGHNKVYFRFFRDSLYDIRIFPAHPESHYEVSWPNSSHIQIALGLRQKYGEIETTVSDPCLVESEIGVRNIKADPDPFQCDYVNKFPGNLVVCFPESSSSSLMCPLIYLDKQRWREAVEDLRGWISHRDQSAASRMKI